MRKKILPVVLGLAILAPIAAGDLNDIVFTADYLAGYYDPYGNWLGGTECLYLVPHKGMLFAAIGYWTDTTSVDPVPGAQVLRKDAPDSPWMEDIHSPVSVRIHSLASIVFETDSTGAPLSSPETLLLAAPDWAVYPYPIKVFSRNDLTGTWEEMIIDSASTKPLVRCFGMHRDTVTGVDMVFAGTGTRKISAGFYDEAVTGKIRWKAEPELDQSWTETGRRVLAFTNCNGLLYASVDTSVFLRYDGESPYWEEVYSWERHPEHPHMRGITAVPNPFGAGEVIIGAREKPGVIERIDPSAGHVVTMELDLHTYFNTHWDTVSNVTLAAYNDMPEFVIPETGDTVNLIGIQVYNPLDRISTWFLVRYRDASYEHYRIHDYFLDPNHPQLRASRTICQSPWESDSGKVIYAGGYDGNSGENHNTAWIFRGELDPKILVHRDIQYDTISGVDPNLLSLDIYRPWGDGDSLLPVVCYVHGGSWRTGDKTNTAYKDEVFTDSGYVFVSINYRLSPNPADTLDPDAIRYPIHDEDVGRALAWVYTNIERYGGDPERIGLTGHSAGAHIVSLVSTDQRFIEDNGVPLSIVKCTCPLDAGGLDIPFYLSISGSGLRELYANAFGTDTTIWPLASPSNHIETGIGIPEFHLVHQNVANRIATHDLFIDSLEAHSVPWSRYIPDSLTHAEINQWIGAYLYIDSTAYFEEESESLTASVLRFFGNCLCGSVGVRETNDITLKPLKYEILTIPNPFNSAVTISAPAGAEIEVFDVNGRKITPPTPLDRGEHGKSPLSKGDLGGLFVWQPGDNITSGVYLVRATIGKESISKRIVYLK